MEVMRHLPECPHHIITDTMSYIQVLGMLLAVMALHVLAVTLWNMSFLGHRHLLRPKIVCSIRPSCWLRLSSPGMFVCQVLQ